MRTSIDVLAFDLGASSGRAMLGSFDGGRITLQEVHRFPNTYHLLGGRAYWDMLTIIENVKNGIAKCGVKPAGIGLDTWGVDFGLLDKAGALVSLPRSYRDSAFNEKNMMEAVDALGGSSFIYHQTYLSNLTINPLFQLYSMKQREEAAFESAHTLLMMANLIEYFLTGVKHSEYTAAATSQLYNMKEKTWSKPLLEKLGFPAERLTEVELPGRQLGFLLPSIAEETGKQGVPVISVAGHDTAGAIMAVPSSRRNFTYLSSGTWSLMGYVSDLLLDDETSGISNEGNWNGAYRPNVNISGLWILQESRRYWQSEGKQYSYDELEALAAKTPPLRSLIRPDDFEKVNGAYPAQIRAYCRKTGQAVPESTGEVVRCILDSLALKYRQVYERFKPRMERGNGLYIVGGGVKNRLLSQTAANALDMPVTAGPPEASALGNILMQLETLGEIRGPEQRSGIIGASFGKEEFLPQDRARWDEAYARFLNLYAE